MTKSGGVGAGLGKGLTENVTPRWGKMFSAGARDLTDTRLGGGIEDWVMLEKGEVEEEGRGGEGRRWQCWGSLASR